MTGQRTYLCYTDGSCKAGDEAPGGWGFVIRSPSGETIEGHGSALGTLAKVMEYRAVAEALAAVPADVSLTLFSDNQSLVENLDKRLADWAARDFAKVDPTIVESVRAIAASVRDKRLEVHWQWLRGHGGNAGNERADALAAQGAREAKASLVEANGRRRKR